MSGGTQTERILNHISALPDGQWLACPGCRVTLRQSTMRRHLGVCPHCGHRARLTADERIAQLTDPGSFEECDTELGTEDPLEFVDQMPYPQRLARARSKTGLREAVVSGVGTLAGQPVVLAVFEFGFLGGSMGSVAGEKIARAAELALRRRIPLITVASSGGARMQEGIFSLLQMAKTAAAVQRLRVAGVPFLSVLADPVYGGVAASFAALGDVIVAESGTRAGFAGPQVIRQTIRQELPKGFQTAEFLLDNGHIDMVVDRGALAGVLRRLVGMLTSGPLPGGAEPAPLSATTAPATAWDAVRLGRMAGRPTMECYLDRIFEDFVELRGDRMSADDPAVIGGLARLGGSPVMVIGHSKGRDTVQNVRRNFGMPQPAGYRKAMRLLELAGRHGLPVITLVDTPGAYPGIDAERENQSGAIAEALALSAGLPIPMINVITGEGGSGGALALAVGDRLLMQENAVYSVISPEGCATILFGDASRAPAAADALRVRSCDLAEFGIADEIVPEPAGGAHTDPDRAAELLGAALRRGLAELAGVPVEELLRRRYRRLRDAGVVAVSAGADDRSALADLEATYA